MKIEQNVWYADGGLKTGVDTSLGKSAQLVLAFGGTDALREPKHFASIRQAYPGAKIIGCSTAGEIGGEKVRDESLIVTACQFDGTPVRLASIELKNAADSFDAGRRLAQTLPHEDLVHLFVISEGIKVNGSELVKGLAKGLPANVAVTGGLSGDGARFEQTLVYADAPARSGIVAAIGFYGRRIKIGYGCKGGWDAFGPMRRITRSKGNVLYELDSQSALSLYKKYLGEHAAQLPSSALQFPLNLRITEKSAPVARTILAVDEKAQSMTFAGDIPQGAFAQMMMANFDRLVDGARDAAMTCCQGVPMGSATLAVLISCVGRKLVLKQAIEDEVEAVRDVVGSQAAITGFYSYGEICPFAPSGACELHNQTMTITTLAEA
ncbi:MAG: FIST N-terminal domain-containing protein [Tepidisphaeraceae bacterium]|jgi:hypothetical protein